MSSRNGHGRQGSGDEVAILAPPLPLLPPGEYAGTVTKIETGFLPRGRRKLRRGETERRQEWRLYAHVRVEQAASQDGHVALEAYRQRHGELPVTLYVCRFEKTGAGEPIRPATSSKIHRLLRMVAGSRILGEVRFKAVETRRFRFTLRTSDTDGDGDPEPRELWHSIIDKLLEVYPPHTPLPVTRYQEPRTNNQPTSTDSSRNQALTIRPPTAGRASRRRDQAGKQPTAPAEVGPPIPVGADADPPVLVAVDPWTR